MIVLNSVVILSDYSSFLFRVQSYRLIDHGDSDGIVKLANKVISFEICLLHFLISNTDSNKQLLTLISCKRIGIALLEVPSYGGRTVLKLQYEFGATDSTFRLR